MDMARSLRQFLLCGFAICAPAYASTIYYGSFTAAGNTVTYAITTDGTTGVLAASNILSVSYSDTGSLGFSTQVATGSEITVVGSDLSATATTLLFNFLDTNQGDWGFFGPTYGVGFNDAFFAPSQGPEEYVEDPYPTASIINSYPPDQIGQSPEPGTLLPALIGSIVFGLAARKRRLRARRS